MEILGEMYRKLHRLFGPQHWWPGDTPFEIAVGAILTQNTNWINVEKAINNLKRHKVLTVGAIDGMPAGRLAELIRSAGYFNVKAQRLKSFIGLLIHDYRGSMKRMAEDDLNHLRQVLLRTNGIGPETADSILLYALRKPVFVIDTYTKRVLSRHGIMGHEKSYDEFQELFHSSMRRDLKMFNEYHALFVRVGKTFCRRRKPLCDKYKCPLNEKEFWI